MRKVEFLVIAKASRIGSFLEGDSALTVMEASSIPAESLPKVLIVGGGFGGLSAAKELAGKGQARDAVAYAR